DRAAWKVRLRLLETEGMQERLLRRCRGSSRDCGPPGAETLSCPRPLGRGDLVDFDALIGIGLVRVRDSLRRQIRLVATAGMAQAICLIGGASGKARHQG